jgi:methionyl aminopeptidase
LCTSINEEIIHGIPSKKRRLKEGDIIGVDCGVTYLGLIADAASTFMVGCVDPRVEKLVRITREALQKAIASIKCYGHVHDISSEIQNHAESNGFSVVRDFCGHGVGKSMHEGPAVPNCGRKGTGTRLEPNMTIAIEPMINMGTHAVKMLSDSWTIVTADGKPSAHFEHSVVITEYGAEILTKK